MAENASDGVIAPMLYMAIGGPALMFLYKGINTMDSMLGYKNDKYLYFGRCAAKLDDVANYIPARIRMADGGRICFYRNGWKNAAKIYKRDREIMQAPTLHRQRLQWQVRWMYSLREMHIISENYMKNQRLGSDPPGGAGGYQKCQPSDVCDIHTGDWLYLV